MATAHLDIPQHRAAISSGLIDDYKDAHQQMLSAVSAMDEVTADQIPNWLRVSHTRLRITRASHECRSAFQKVAPILSRDGTPAITRVVEEFDRRHLALKEVTLLHIAAWTLSEIQSDWEGYCVASAEVRGRWRQIIECERELLFPLLLQ